MTTTDGVEKPIFLVGCGRSGTTLLYEILAQHPDVGWFSNVTDHVPAAPQLAILHRLGPAVRARLGRYGARPVEGYNVWDHAIVDVADADAPLTRDDVTDADAERVRRAVATHLAFSGKPRFLNKNTRNARRTRYLHAIFPDARFVHVVRDPRATVASLLQVAFWPSMPIWWAGAKTPRELASAGRDEAVLAGEFWAREVQRILDDRTHIPDEQWLDVRYEDLVSDPVATASRVLEHARLREANEITEAVTLLAPEDRNTKFSTQLDRNALRAVCEEVSSQAMRFGYALGD